MSTHPQVTIRSFDSPRCTKTTSYYKGGGTGGLGATAPHISDEGAKPPPAHISEDGAKNGQEFPRGGGRDRNTFLILFDELAPTI